MALLGLLHAGDRLAIFNALNPGPAVGFVASHGLGALPVIGAVFLAVTGAEALYADMGHFGRGPIRIAWLGLVFPALTLNYLGQGGLVLARPETVENRST
jgi:KUP system potassium uptake protein